MFLSILGKRHEFGRNLVCWQGTAFRQVGAAGVILRFAMQLPGARGLRRANSVHNSARKEESGRASENYGEEFMFQGGQNCQCREPGLQVQ